jgi:hypothetical protein
LGEGPRSGGTGRREEEKGESRGDIKLGQGQRYWRTVGGGEHDFWEKRRGRRRTHAPFFNIEIVFSRNQAHEILLNLSHLLVHSIKVLEIRAEPRKKKKGDGSPCWRWEDAAGRGVLGGGEAETSPETGTARLAATSSVEVRSKNIVWGFGTLEWGCGGCWSAVVARVWWLPGLGKIVGVRWSPELRKIAGLGQVTTI